MKIKKKYTTGTARVFISRKKAIRKLQLSLKDFRRLCILKGIYPREPNHIKKANKGGTQNRIFYNLRDVNFLAQEPLLQKFREYKIFLRKVRHAQAKKEGPKVDQLIRFKPIFTYDHIVKERYPTFSSALNDLDDALCLCFAFASLTQSKMSQLKIINRCRRLVTELMHYVIEANALRKVFISIKGIYYQAEIMGERVTWIVGHDRAIGNANNLDFTAMANFVEFYTCMLSFVNYRLYKSIGLFYPPQLQQQQISEENDYEFKKTTGSSEFDDRIYSLAFPIRKTEKVEPEVTIDVISEDRNNGEDLADKLRQIESLKVLFSKFKFFLNREVPKEALAFVIRSCGGFVCWEGCSPNSLSETSELITHQVVDRNLQKMDINRIYIQPQWVFDCFNARRLLPTLKYAPTATLPPHLSPFVDNQNIGEYLTAERIEQLKTEGKDLSQLISYDDQLKKPKAGKKENKEPLKSEKGMRVQKARVHRDNHQKKINEEGQNLKLKEMMIAKKHKRVYEKIKRGIKNKAREENKLNRKRAKLDI